MREAASRAVAGLGLFWIYKAHWCRAAVSDYHAIWGPPRWAPEWPVSTSSLLPLTLSSAPVPSQVILGSSHPFADQGRSPNCRGAVTLPLPQQLSDHQARCAVLSETHPRGLALAGVCGGVPLSTWAAPGPPLQGSPLLDPPVPLRLRPREEGLPRSTMGEQDRTPGHMRHGPLAWLSWGEGAGARAVSCMEPCYR